MRKEVKLGMAIGGGLIALLAVYLLIAPPGNNKKGAQLSSGTPGNTVDGSQGGDGGGLSESPSPVAAPDNSATASRGGDPWAVVHTGRGTPAPAPAVTPRSTPANPETPRETPRTAERTAGTSATPTNPAPAPERRATAFTDPHAAFGGGVSTDAVFGSPSTPRTNVVTSEPATSNAAGATHVVKQGETFSSIALAVYGSSNYYHHIIKANPSVNPTALRPGQTINLPSHETIKASAKPAADLASPAHDTTSEVKIDPTRQYRVKQGDSLYRISITLYGKSSYVDKIYEKNKAAIGADPKKLKLGMILELPEKTEAPASATPANTTTSTVTSGATTGNR